MIRSNRFVTNPARPSLRAALLGLSLALLVGFSPVAATAQEQADKTEKAASLDELLKRVQTNWRKEKGEMKKREAEFLAAKKDQGRLLSEAKTSRTAEENRSDELETAFEQNELRIAEQEDLLASRLGNLGELFGVVRQVAGDTRGQVAASVVSAQLGDREAFLARLGQSKTLPAIEDLETLYGTLLEEMVESGRVTRFQAPVVKVGGEESQQSVVRVGAFNAISDGKYLVWNMETSKLSELGRQPGGKYLGTVSGLEEATSGFVPFALDPARGSILQVLIKTPSFRERIEFGGYVGYTIIGLGLATMVVGLLRLIVLILTSMKVSAQRKHPDQPGNNPLGRVLSVYKENRSLDSESLELKLEESILNETNKLERFLWIIKVVSAVAPLMGLLGTVTGMIRTFQVITLFGTGDPKLMAGGISEALVTTMLGLVVAIPLVLLHSYMSSIVRTTSNVLEEQGTGMIAAQSEAAGAEVP